MQRSDVRFFQRQRLAAALLACCALPAHADDGVQWNGFLNIVGGALRDEAYQEQRDVIDGSLSPDYAGYNSKDIDFDTGSSAGLQAETRLDDNLSATLQLLAKGDRGSYEASLRWMYLTWEPAPNSTVRIGRLGTPTYYFSDYLNIGYAYHWVSPPEEVYPFDTTFSGINYTYQDLWRDMDWSLELMAGAGSDYLTPINATVDTRDTAAAIFSISPTEWLSFRAMAFRTNSTFDIDDLTEDTINRSVGLAVDLALASASDALNVPVESLEVLRPGYSEATLRALDDKRLDLADFPVRYGALAMRAENNRWLFMTEITTLQSNHYIFNDTVTHYVTGGVRFGQVLYHLTTARSKINAHDKVIEDLHNTIPASASNEDVGEVLASLVRTRIAAAAGRFSKSVSVGARVELNESTAFKVELTRARELPWMMDDIYGNGDNMLLRVGLNAIF